MSQIIEFYKIGDAYGEFSNFAPYPIFMDGERWPTSEHYFQAQKFREDEHREAIRQVASPMIAARMGRSRKRMLRPDWEAVKNDVMRAAILAKFTQHEELRSLLLSTGDAVLVEHSPNDGYWGDGGDGSGQNMLGEILMATREGLRARPDSPAMNGDSR